MDRMILFLKHGLLIIKLIIIFFLFDIFSIIQNNSYPSRTYSDIQGGLPRTYYKETDDRFGIFSDFSTITQNNAYPSRNYSDIQGDLPLTYYNETNDRFGISPDSFNITQNNTYPSRNYSYVQGGLPPTYYNETDDRFGILRDVVNDYQLENGANRRVNITRDIDDDEIYV